METWRRFDFKYVVLLCVNEKKCDFTAAARRTRLLSWALMSCCGMKTQTELLTWSLTVRFILSCSALCNLWSRISDPELLNVLQLFNWSSAQPVSPGGNNTGMPQLWLKEMLTSLRLQEKQAARSLGTDGIIQWVRSFTRGSRQVRPLNRTGRRVATAAVRCFDHSGVVTRTLRVINYTFKVKSAFQINSETSVYRSTSKV